MNSMMNTFKGMVYGNGVTAFFRIALGLLFVVSGAEKMLDPAAFGKTVGMYGLLPGELVPLAALTIPPVEILSGGLLAAGYRIRPAALIVSAMLTVFMAAVAYNYARGLRFDCGCLGLARLGFDEQIGPAVMARDLFLLAVSTMLYRAKKHTASIEFFAERVRLHNL